TDLGYPADEIERELLLGESAKEHGGVDELEAVFTHDALRALFAAVDEVALSEAVATYVQQIAKATREAKALRTGVSTRGAVLCARAARARARREGRRFVTPDDVYALSVAVCAHRVVLRGSERPSREEAEAVVREIVGRVAVPV